MCVRGREKWCNKSNEKSIGVGREAGFNESIASDFSISAEVAETSSFRFWGSNYDGGIVFKIVFEVYGQVIVNDEIFSFLSLVIKGFNKVFNEISNVLFIFRF